MADFRAPAYSISVEGNELGEEITRFIQSVEYESVDGYADMARVVVSNPDLVYVDSKLFQPGNELSIFMGYGTQLVHIGRVRIVRPEPNFPADAMPTITLKGYTLDYLMMDNSPEEGAARRHANLPYHLMVADVADRNGFTADIDSTEGNKNAIQKPGMSDYDFVKGISNLTGFLFWVDGDENGEWTLHFKNPETTQLQDQIFTFEYNRGNDSSLISFDGESTLRDSRTKLKAVVRDPQSGKVFTEIIEDDADQPDVQFTGDPRDETADEQTSAAAVKLFFGDFSIDVVANKRFKSGKELRLWAAQWFRRNREQFVVGRAAVIGVESIAARQVHNLEGIGRSYSGRYQFTRVRHIMAADTGYKLDITARKLI